MKKIILFVLSFCLVLLIGCGDNGSSIDGNNNDDNVDWEGTSIQIFNNTNNEIKVCFGSQHEFSHVISAEGTWNYELPKDLVLSSWNEDSKKYIFSCITDSNFIIDNEHEIELKLGNNVDYYLNTNAASFKIENQYLDKSVIGVSVTNCSNYSFNEIEFEEPIAPLSTGYARIPEGEYNIFLVYDDETTSLYHNYKLINGHETDYIAPNLIKISNFTNDIVTVLIDNFNCLDITANTECLCEYFLKESGIVHVEINGLLVKNQSLDIPANNTSIASTSVYSDTGALLIHNDSDIVASGVYVVNSYNDTWGEDILSIAQHGTRGIQLDSGNYKARIVDPDGNNEMIFNNIYISVNQITEITYKANR